MVRPQRLDLGYEARQDVSDAHRRAVLAAIEADVLKPAAEALNQPFQLGDLVGGHG
jgi:hypothetical protein